MRKSPYFIFMLLTTTALLISACTGGGGAGQVVTSTVQDELTPAAMATTASTPETAASPTAVASPTVAESPSPAVTETTAAGADTTQTPAAGGETGGLSSVMTTAAPELDGAGDDAAWADAPEVVIETSGGENESDTQVTIKSVYDQNNVYFLLTWADPTQSFLRAPWEKQQDGSWKKLVSPENKGGDENEYYEDKIAFIWSIDNSIENFDTQGCFTACHAGENSDVKPYGNKYTSSPEEKGDIWHWKSVRNVGQVDDQFLDNTQYSPDTPEAGRKSDENTGGGYKDNQTEDKKSPAFMAPNGGDKTGAPGFISDAEKVALDPNLFAAGDRVPSVVVAPYEGDRGDLSAGWQYNDGQWTLEISRELVTGSDTDVQFDDLDNTYYFGVATFDNAQVRHAFESGATAFTFQK